MRTRGAASALLLAVLVLAISAAPACKTGRRDKRPNLAYRPTTTTTTTATPTTTPRRVFQIPMHNVSHTSIIIAPNKPCPPGQERDHKGRCRIKIEE